MAEKGSGKLLSLADWEQLFHDFRSSLALQHKWLAAWPGLTILDQALQSLPKKDFPLKPPLLVFLEENAPALFEDSTPVAMSMLVDALKLLLNTPVDGVAVTFALKEQLLVTATAIAIDVDAIHAATPQFETLIETLLAFISRTNSSIDRHVRGAACECLKALEMAHPGLLHLCVGHVFAFCQSERTHVSQAYKLLFLAVLHNMACWMYSARGRGGGGGAFLAVTVPVVPFSVPGFLVGEGAVVPARELNAASMKEFKRAVAYLLQHLDLLTEFALLEFTTRFLNIAKALDLHGSLLRPTVAGHLYVYNPVMIHTILIIVTHFPKAFEGEEHQIVKRLATFCRESQQPLPIRLLGLHWLLGFQNQATEIDAAGLYPRMYDPLALHAMKLAALAQCASHLEAGGGGGGGIFKVLEMGAAPADAASQVLNEGLLCLSSFTWLPRSSTETRIAFFVLHRFLTSQATTPALLGTVQLVLVRMAVRILSLIPSILQLLDQLLACEAHHELGEHLLRTFDEDLLPQLGPSRNLPAYFPLLERIAENPNIPPARLLELLTLYVRKRVEEDKGDSGLRLWQRGNQVLGICCKVLTHHQSSRGFHGLVPLLTFMCRFFPDLDCRDTARLYLRMLISIPGEPLRKILRHGDKQIKEGSAASQYNTGSDPDSQPITEVEVSEYVKLTRESTLLVRHSWSLVLYSTFQTPDSPEVIVEEISDQEEAKCTSSANNKNLQVTTANAPKEKKGGLAVPRVMDAKTATILGVLRQHFEEIPGSGVKIMVRCRLRFVGEALPGDSDSWPAIYAVVVSFLTAGLYGPIPSVHVPFLLSEAPQKSSWRAPGAESPTSVIKAKSGEDSDDENQVSLLLEGETSGETIVVELEPKQPVPTLVDAHIVFSDESGRTVQGQLDSIPVGIEDLFQKPLLPEALPLSERAEYLFSLFKALFEACSGPGHLGGETFPLKNAAGVSIEGSESVKLLEGQADRIVGAVEQWLAPFVVAVTGPALIAMVRDGGVLKHPMFPDEDEFSFHPERSNGAAARQVMLRLEDAGASRGAGDSSIRALEGGSKGRLGCFLVLIFLPPRFHLLLRMEVSDWSTLVRIRTDHWPCLAHVDEFLEALVMSR